MTPDTPLPDPAAPGGDARLRFELEVQPETTRCAWHAWLRGLGPGAPAAEFESPMALLRFLAHLHGRQPGRPGPSGLR